tara:strand:+ start:93 stop:266 length:174 start_codon:yes stop_codon:yes gene_type:complete
MDLILFNLLISAIEIPWSFFGHFLLALATLIKIYGSQYTHYLGAYITVITVPVTASF